MVLSDIDLRLLRVFDAVVEAGGFSNAQAVLNVSQSTISNQMSQLESRVGCVLCQRGRGGFSLTAEGQQFHEQVLALFRSIKSFETRTTHIRGGLSGALRIAFLDNIINDSTCPLREGLAEFTRKPNNRVQIQLDVLSPALIQQGVLNHSIDLGIGIFSQSPPGLHPIDLYRERDLLVCHRSHPLAHISDPRVLARALPTAARVYRSFLGNEEFPFEARETPVASVTSLEASALMIMTGSWIGFLPKHYASAWLEQGELVALLPEKFFRHSTVTMITRDEACAQSKPLRTLVDCLITCRDRASAAIQIGNMGIRDRH